MTPRARMEMMSIRFLSVSGMSLMLVNVPCDDKTLCGSSLKRSAQSTNVVDDECSDAGSEEDQSSVGEISDAGDASDAGDSSDPFVDHPCVFLLKHSRCWMLISGWC